MKLQQQRKKSKPFSFFFKNKLNKMGNKSEKTAEVTVHSPNENYRYSVAVEKECEKTDKNYVIYRLKQWFVIAPSEMEINRIEGYTHVYLEVTLTPEHRKTIEETLEFLRKKANFPKGLFYGSLVPFLGLGNWHPDSLFYLHESNKTYIEDFG
jgi:hypothetical protein